MPIQNCPYPACNIKLKIPDKSNGKKINCPKCKGEFVAGAPPLPATPPIDTRIFISHAVEDGAFVRPNVREFFKSHKIATWICSEDIPVGVPYNQAITGALNNSDWFLLVISPRSAKSQAVREEVSWAFENRRGRILPILMESTPLQELHPELPDIQYVDFTKNSDRSQAQRHLLVSMVRQLNKERNDLEQTSEQQSRTVEDLRTENADLATRRRDLEGRVRRAANFDGNWSQGGGGGIVPAFKPLKARGVPIVAVCNLKGGVGKTTVTANLGATLWGEAFRKRVLLIDLDYQGSLSTICLDPSVRKRVTEGNRLSQELFKQPQTSDTGRHLMNLAQAVTDPRTRNHQGSIIAADENLARAEGEVLGRWMMQEPGMDGRYLLRNILHTSTVQNNFDIVLIDCPPRMTAACINAFLAADFLLIPTPLEEICAEAVPRLLHWVRERREDFLANLNVLGAVVSQIRQQNGELQQFENELLVRLKDDCNEAWGRPTTVFETFIPMFPAAANNHKYPAQYAGLRGYFGKLLAEMPALTVSPSVAGKPSAPEKSRK